MGFALGNLTIDELIRRTGYDMSNEDKAILNKYRQDNATISPYDEALHIFDLPFAIYISEPIYDMVFKILCKYNDINSSNEPLQVVKVEETEKQRERRLEEEKYEKEKQERRDNPNSKWLVKYHMLVPIKVNDYDAFYNCFINVYIQGYYNIPNIVDGTLTIRMDEDGFHGTFTLHNNEDYILEDEYKYVIGSGFSKKNGNWVGHIDDAYFEDTTYSIKSGILNYRDIDYHSSGMEIYHQGYVK